MIAEMTAAIFDLDGVIVDTAKYHYLAWKRLAAELGFAFTEKDNEGLKGVSRERSLEILLSVGGVSCDASTRARLAEKKNAWYVEHITVMGPEEILPGADAYIRLLRRCGVKTALGSASRNAPLILERLGISGLFDAVVDGRHVAKAKPDPEVFLRAAAALGVEPGRCVVFEDAVAGVQAARNAGMRCVGVGSPSALREADAVVPGLGTLLSLLPAARLRVA